MTRIKKYFLILLLLELLLAYSSAYAQTPDYTQAGVSSQIEKLLCAPTPVKPSETNSTGTGNNFQTSKLQQYATTNNANQYDLYTCINRLYKFAIILAVVIGVFFLVIAGYIYMSAEGNAESVDKAKSILVSTVTALVILLTGFLLLKTINPDLVQFQTVQPCSVVDCTVTTAAIPTTVTGTGGGAAIGLPTGCTVTVCIIDGFNMASYTHDVGYQSQIADIAGQQMANFDFTTAAGIDNYIKTKVPSSPITGAMVMSSSQNNGNVDPRMIVAIMLEDSTIGTQGVAKNTFNPGNIKYVGQAGATQGPAAKDGGYFANFGNWQTGVDYVAKWLNTHRG